MEIPSPKIAITSPALSLGTHASTARRLRALARSFCSPYSIGRATPITPTERTSHPRTGARVRLSLAMKFTLRPVIWVPIRQASATAFGWLATRMTGPAGGTLSRPSTSMRP